MSRVRVVLIDDEPVLCRLLARVLERRAGAQVTIFSEPEPALAYLETAAVDVVLCDFRMPRMSGVELRQRLTRDIPFYVVTGELAAVERVRRIPGVLAVLEKPVPPERLVEVVLSHAPEG
jgi:CheY-like chemotaxis protein